MKGFVPQDVVEELRERADIVNLVEQVVPLKRSGSSFVGCCPFHQEKTPSFHINPSKQLYYCFGCGEGGNVYHFLMKHYHLSFPESIEYLAKDVGFDLEPILKKHVRENPQRELQVQVLNHAVQRFQKFLLGDVTGKGAQRYLHQRDISLETIGLFQIGFAPDGWTRLVEDLGSKKVWLAQAHQTGLIAPKKEGDAYYDVFRHRIMIPIQDAKGNMIGFGARAMGDEQPKYLNSPQTPLFDKSKVLFGLHRAEAAMRAKKNVFVVEGYFDQISLFVRGIEHVVATMGTAMTLEHAKKLKRYVPRVTLVFDGDAAGLRACKKAGTSVLTVGLNADVIEMPKGMDPDAFIRQHGKTAFSDLPRVGILDFLIERFYFNVDILSEKTQFLEEMVTLVRNISQKLIGKALQDELSKKMGLDPSVFQKKSTARFEPAFLPDRALKPKSNILQEAVLALVLYIQHINIRDQIKQEDFLELLNDQVLQNYAQKAILGEKMAQNPMNWIDQWDNPAYKDILAKVLVSLDMYIQEDVSLRVWKDCLAKLKKRYAASLVQSIQSFESSGDMTQVHALSKKMIQVQNF